MYTLHKIPEGFIVTSGEQIKEGDINVPSDMTSFKDFSVTSKEDLEVLNEKQNGYKKVIAQESNIIFSALKKEEQKEIGWFDVKKLANEYSNYEAESKWGDIVRNAYEAGFQKAQELFTSDKRFTLKDMHNAALEGGLIAGLVGIENPKEAIDQISKYIQSLSQPQSWNVELEMEEIIPECFTYGMYGKDEPPTELIPKLTDGKVRIVKLLK